MVRPCALSAGPEGRGAQGTHPRGLQARTPHLRQSPRPSGTPQEGSPGEPQAGHPAHAGRRAGGSGAEEVPGDVGGSQRAAAAAQPAGPAVRCRPSQPALGGRHDRADHARRQGVPGRNPGPLQPLRRGLGPLRGERPSPDDAGTGHGLTAPLSRGRAAPPLGPGQHLRQRRLPGDAQPERHRVQQEQTRQLLRQRRDGERVFHPQERARGALRVRSRRQGPALRLQRDRLRSDTDAIGHRIRFSGRV